jgi:SWIM zinc finger
VTEWTTETIIALAPDSSSASSGRGLSTRKSWLNVARNGNVLWGECQGSGKHPYQARVDTSGPVGTHGSPEPVFKCSCPSRKFPCKHGLGLFLLFASKPDEFGELEPPTWVQEWLDGREARAEKKAEKAVETASKPVDPKAQEKRIAARDKKVRAGLEELALWSRDLIRTGIADAQSKGYTHWETMAARLIDAQAPGLARMVREIPGLLSQDDWQARLLEQLGAVHLASTAYQRLEELPEPVRADTRTAIGFPTSSEEVLAQTGIRDAWQVIAQSLEQDDRLRVRRTWLHGTNNERGAMVQEFGVAQAPLGLSLPLGSSIDVEVVYYPGQHPQRALVKGDLPAPTPVTHVPGLSIEENLNAYAQARAASPWLERYFFRLHDATLQTNNTVINATDHSLPVHPQFAQLWPWLAVTGGSSGTICGEWDGESFLPLSVMIGDTFHNFAFDGVNA